MNPVLSFLYPALRAGVDYTLHQDGSINQWTASVTRPTSSQLAAGASLLALFAGLAAEREGMTLGERALVGNGFDTVRGRMLRGVALIREGKLATLPATIAQAKAVVQTFPALTPSLAAAQGRMLALFPAD